MEDPNSYLITALDLLENRALNRRRVDWAALRRDLPPVASVDEAHTAIGAAIAALGDPHTFLLTPGQVAEAFSEEAVQASPVPTGELTPAGHAHLRIPEASGVQEPDLDYVRAGAALIAGLDTHRPAGWIVDLRGNTGGNMYPMLTVLAPLLGDGVAGWFVDADGEPAGHWILRGGVVHHDDEALSPEPHPYRLARPEPPIAVLTDGDTMSAAEATLIAFLGLPNVRTFGHPTAGLATGNAAHELGDGALLVLTEVREADRTGRVHGTDPIVPDEPAADALTAATTWLRTVAGGR